jgi:hypothetical protein
MCMSSASDEPAERFIEGIQRGLPDLHEQGILKCAVIPQTVLTSQPTLYNAVMTSSTGSISFLGKLHLDLASGKPQPSILAKTELIREGRRGDPQPCGCFFQSCLPFAGGLYDNSGYCVQRHGFYWFTFNSSNPSCPVIYHSLRTISGASNLSQQFLFTLSAVSHCVPNLSSFSTALRGESLGSRCILTSVGDFILFHGKYTKIPTLLQRFSISPSAPTKIPICFYF